MGSIIKYGARIEGILRNFDKSWTGEVIDMAVASITI
jgi:hypothetical protein